MKKNIVLAGGCFWGVEAYFNNLKGVLETSVGYANGNFENPTYEQVCNNIATHAEAVNISYESNLITLPTILDHFFRFVNPYTLNQQGNDVGIQYRSGIYYLLEEDREVINKYLTKLQSRSKEKVVVELEKLENYYLAEDFHQSYLDKNPTGYCHVDLKLLKDSEKKRI